MELPSSIYYDETILRIIFVQEIVHWNIVHMYVF